MSNLNKQTYIYTLRNRCNNDLWDWYLGIGLVKRIFNYGQKEQNHYMIVFDDWIN